MKNTSNNNELVFFNRNDNIVSNQTLEAEIYWASEFIKKKCSFYIEEHTENQPPLSQFVISPPPHIENECIYSSIVSQLKAERFKDEIIPWYHSAERLILALSVMPHLYPFGLAPLAQLASTPYYNSLVCPSSSIHSNAFQPSIDTALFLIAGEDLSLRREAIRIFSREHPFSRMGVLNFPQPPMPALQGSAPIQLTQEFYSLIVEGKPYSPKFSSDFAAHLLEVRENWTDLVTHEETLYALEDINLWLKHREEMNNDSEISKKIKKGYRALFFGPSGTGKTMSAGLIGKMAGLPVYRIDLSAVVSKYIGETEKNLEAIFQKAENKDWILFFDEADALFGKRTQTNTANDRYANQEVSYLLQRIEDFDGLVILSSNLKSNMDSAFTRRFQNIIKFYAPSEEMRKILFQRAFSGKFALHTPQILDEACNKKYSLTGAEINNIFRYCAMRVISSKEDGVSKTVFSNGLITELKKKGNYSA